MRKFILCLAMLMTLTAATCVQAADVKLAWDHSITPTVTGYKVYMGSATGVYGTPITIGYVTTYTVPNVAPGKYFFAVTAFDAQGNESGYSNEVSTTINAKPAAPVTLTITVIPKP
jgi:hypothetical protein